MTVLIVVEKPSAARNFAKALGGMAGAFEGTAYKIAALRGHLYEFADVADQVPPASREQYKKWDLANLPWDEKLFAWKRVGRGDTAQVVGALKSAAAGVDEICCATDLDPTGEGALLFAEPILEERITAPTFTRMRFTDEAEKSIQQAFRDRVRIPGDDITRLDEYQKAITRAKLDFLTQQHTRIASECAAQGTLLRQGRLKSAMLLLVGDQLEAHNSYVKTVSYQNRFRDENGVLYTDPEQPLFATEAEAKAAMARFHSGPVVVDSKTVKTTAPPRLLDLAALSSRLAPRGAKPADVLKVYQDMYEAQVVSYPRTEDRTITPAQFDELAPLVDRIARAVGVDVGLLTHRAKRGTHVKDSGAHGANRPGPSVPGSLAEVKGAHGELGAAIYEELARSFLAMFAEDYRYEAQVGHVEPHPTFVGKAAVPLSPGWKAVFTTTDDEDEDQNKAGLGTVARPCVFEVVPKRPEHPTMSWLMRQLDKHDVGTGATRTSTYAELTRDRSEKNKWPLMIDCRGRTTLTEYGEQGYRLLPGTRIGDLGATAWVYQRMRDVAAGSATTEEVIAVVAEWVRHDIETMRTNAPAMWAALGLKPRAPREMFEGVWAPTGEQVKFNRLWSGHRFTDDECRVLLAGGTVAGSQFVSTKTGKTFEAHGKLDKGTFKGNETFGFQVVGFGPPPDASGRIPPPSSWCGHVFTDDEKRRLAAGENVAASDFVSKLGKPFAATVRFEQSGGQAKIIPDFASGNNKPQQSTRSGQRRGNRSGW